jgi:hypothetical protein
MAAKNPHFFSVFFLPERADIAVLAIWIQPEGLFTICWLLMFDVADMEVLGLSSWESPFLQGSQCSRLRRDTTFRTVIRTFLRELPVDAVNSVPLRLEVKQQLAAEMAFRKAFVSAVVLIRKDEHQNKKPRGLFAGFLRVKST